MLRARNFVGVVPPQTLLDLKLQRVLGSGNYGRVILGMDHSGSSFAVKGLNKAVTLARDEVEQVCVCVCMCVCVCVCVCVCGAVIALLRSLSILLLILLLISLLYCMHCVRHLSTVCSFSPTTA
jgi:hypothetical protein